MDINQLHQLRADALTGLAVVGENLTQAIAAREAVDKRIAGQQARGAELIEQLGRLNQEISRLQAAEQAPKAEAATALEG